MGEGGFVDTGSPMTIGVKNGANSLKNSAQLSEFELPGSGLFTLGKNSLKNPSHVLESSPKSGFSKEAWK